MQLIENAYKKYILWVQRMGGTHAAFIRAENVRYISYQTDPQAPQYSSRAALAV